MINVEVDLPEGCVLVGYIAHLKVMKPDGSMVWAQRSKDISDMEALGMAVTMVENIKADLNGMTRPSP